MTIHDNFPRPACPRCDSHQILKNGSTHHKKRKYLCKDCGYQFIDNPTKKNITDSEKDYIKSLLLERISLAGIARTLNISMKWLQDFVNGFFREIPCQIKLSGQPEGEIIIECDELWSFVNSKNNQEWVWIAMERNRRRIVGMYIGDRSRESAKRLWESIPEAWRECQVFYTDGLKSYCEAIPEKVHQSTLKGSGKTNHIERFNNTLRQRCSRLVRKALSFSKSWFNHEGAIWYFVHHYNANLENT